MANSPIQTVPNSAVQATGDAGSYNLAYRGAAGSNRQTVMLWTEDDNRSTLAGPPDNGTEGGVQSQQVNLLRFWVNPAECQWRVGMRTQIEPIQGGAIHHQWDSVGIGAQNRSKMDQPMLSFTFQSGLILPNGTNDSGRDGDEPVVAPGLANFYDFLQLLSQNTVRANGQPNYVNIAYVSSVFPSLLLKGFFTPEGVQWTDSSDNPYMVNSWSASFVVFRSDPDITNAALLKETFKNAYFRGR